MRAKWFGDSLIGVRLRIKMHRTYVCVCMCVKELLLSSMMFIRLHLFCAFDRKQEKSTKTVHLCGFFVLKFVSFMFQEGNIIPGKLTVSVCCKCKSSWCDFSYLFCMLLVAQAHNDKSKKKRSYSFSFKCRLNRWSCWFECHVGSRQQAALQLVHSFSQWVYCLFFHLLF